MNRILKNGNENDKVQALDSGADGKIEKNPAEPVYVTTEVGVGYRMTDES